MTDAYRTGPSQVGGTSAGTVDAVNDETSTLTGDATDAGRNVVDAAKEEAAGVVEDVKFELADLFEQAKGELREQAATQQTRAAEGLHTVSDDLRGMAQTSTGGLAADLVSQASRRANTVASWLDNRDPDSVVEDVRRFARRRPGTFILIAAGVGLLAGRITRSAADNASDRARTQSARAVRARATADSTTPVYTSLTMPDDAAVQTGDAQRAPGTTGEFGVGAAQRQQMEDR